MAAENAQVGRHLIERKLNIVLWFDFCYLGAEE